MSDIKLTELTGSYGGWTSKIGSDTLAQVLCSLPTFHDDRLLVGYDISDGAVIYQLVPELALIQTMDIFPPAMDDAYECGQIAAANSLSDVWIMGGEARLYMNILILPEYLPLDTVRVILRGGYDKAAEAEAIAVGGHTVKGDTPKHGLYVSDVVYPDHILRNNFIQKDGVLVLIRPLGTGILTNADRGGLLSGSEHKAVADCIAALNKYVADVIRSLDEVHAYTGVTGFSLLDHGYEMCGESGLTVIIDSSYVPLLPGVDNYASMSLVPAVAYRNMKHLKDEVALPKDLPSHAHDLLFDPRTSGGLLYSVTPQEAGRIMEALQKTCQTPTIIGHVEDPPPHPVTVI